ncbi:WecB/TagA/CpsF family glycosyltransferase [Brachyspira pilosicoli]|uniref:UDP-N-acetyl-D-mannosamine transferase n=1 Tax=Brachyspira pilosicoli TaxID=52584 RepID=A0A5C8EQR9_BRAPL|nr:WecB/TagA/CpsF family glycosyltransferase [Brachyspira pilosicoli]TXJ39434.1 UDP-N-acetyl-D-mannosamine transferase [Brachyspira pilosicoli]
MINKNSLLGIRIDTFNNDLYTALDQLKDGNDVLIVTLDVHQLLSVRFNKKLKNIIENASLVIAAHPSISKAYKFIYKEELEYIKDFNLFSSVLSYIEQRKMTMFLFGDEEKYFFTITEKMKKIYPDISILGTYQNTKNKSELDKAFIGFKKMNPDVFFIYMPFKKSLYWFNENRGKLGMKLCVPISRPLDCFCGKKKSPNMKVIEANKEEFFYLKRNIFRIFLYFDYIKFWILVFFEKVSVKRNKKRIIKNAKKEAKMEAKLEKIKAKELKKEEKRALKEAKKEAKIEAKRDKIRAKELKKEEKQALKESKKALKEEKKALKKEKKTLQKEEDKKE